MKTGIQNGSWKHNGVAILISDKIDLKPKLVRIFKEEHFMFIKETIHQDRSHYDYKYTVPEHRCTWSYKMNAIKYKFTY